MPKSKQELLTLLQSKKALSAPLSKDMVVTFNIEFDKLKKVVKGLKTPSNDKHKDRVVKAKPKPCWIYLGIPIEHPTILLTQVRHTQFDYVEECEEYCKATFSSYTIKDMKGNVLIKV